ncbi:MAG TPA: ATP-binding cassette domain-containing protein [Candidatus Cybelea sp.]|nr:ATP-binding cassette domain-containing protein [Candidatus Cybelea sp.]
MIEVRDLVKHYNVAKREGGFGNSVRAFFRRQRETVKAVDGIGFSIGPGEIVGFLGPNGAGKTTTLKMLAGLLYPTSGSIRVAGFLPQERKRAFLGTIAMVLGQKQQLIWDLPPADTFLLNKEIYGVSDADYRERLAELTAMLDLGDLVNRQARKLSLGERMKCELAAALIHRPKVLFLDEPTIGLDVNMQQALRDFIAGYNRRTGATILLTSHYMADVSALCKRVIVINQGRLLFDGDLAAILQKMAIEKSVKLHFSEAVPRERLEPYGKVASADGLAAELHVPRAVVAGLAQRVLAELPVADIAIEDTPIETVIGRFMTTGAASA